MVCMDAATAGVANAAPLACKALNLTGASISKPKRGVCELANRGLVGQQPGARCWWRLPRCDCLLLW